MEKIFNLKANFTLDKGYMNDKMPFIESIELQALKIIGKDNYEWVEEHEANAFGVYLRYTDEAVKSQNLNPSEWIADFDTKEAAIQLKELLQMFLSYKGNSQDVITESWSVDDILNQAEQDEIELTTEEAREVLKLVHSEHDATIGINWDVISIWISWFDDKRKTGK